MIRLGEPDALVRSVLTHLSQQRGVTGEILFVEQKVECAFDAAEFANDRWTCRVLRHRLPGHSAARNLSLKEAAHDRVFFCDADALAAPDWAVELNRAFSDPSVAVAGSRILPKWSGSPPYFAASRVVRDQFSIYDLGEDTLEVPRIVGAGFGLDRSRCSQEMQFDEKLGRRGGRLFGGEESDLCRRVSSAGWRIVYVGKSTVQHVIQPDRQRLAWITKRLFYAGHDRGQAGGAPAPSRRPSLADWLLLPVILPPYALGWLWGKLR